MTTGARGSAWAGEFFSGTGDRGGIAVARFGVHWACLPAAYATDAPVHPVADEERRDVTIEDEERDAVRGWSERDLVCRKVVACLVMSRSI